MILASLSTASRFSSSGTRKPLTVCYLAAWGNPVSADLQDPAGNDVLHRLFGSKPRPDPARTRLLQSIEVLPAGRVPGVRSAAPAGHYRMLAADYAGPSRARRPPQLGGLVADRVAVMRRRP